MEARAVIKHIRISPKKLRLVANVIRGKKVEDALVQLSLLIVKGAAIAKKALNSAVANMKVKDREAKDFVIKTVCVDSGVTWKRIMPAAMGRANRIRKRNSHLTVIIESRGSKAAAVQSGADKVSGKDAAAEGAARKPAAKKAAPKPAADKTDKKSETKTKKAPAKKPGKAQA